ncbi:Nuclease harbi1-like protein [Camponotus japonicus]
MKISHYQKNLIPYPGLQCNGMKNRRIFNYRLSRARRCAENAFGVMAARFQIYRSAMRYNPDDACKIILATCLHNMLGSQSIGHAMYTPPSFLDREDEISGEFHREEWRIENKKHDKFKSSRWQSSCKSSNRTQKQMV